jgi:excisionase family DNA binding protein
MKLVDRLFSLRDSAEKLGISYGTVRNWIDKGYIRAVHYPSGVRKIPETEINRLLERMFEMGPAVEETEEPAPRRRSRPVRPDEWGPAV